MEVEIGECLFFFFFNDTATTEIYTLSLHDALPISRRDPPVPALRQAGHAGRVHADRDPDRLGGGGGRRQGLPRRSEEHTSELQSRQYLVCRLLLEKKKNLPMYFLSLTTPLIQYQLS